MRPNPAFLALPFTGVLLLMPAWCAPDLYIVNTPISISEEHTDLTNDNLEAHYGLTMPGIFASRPALPCCTGQPPTTMRPPSKR